MTLTYRTASPDGSAPHNGLQSRQCKKAGLVTLIKSSDNGDDGRTTILYIAGDDGPIRPDLLPVRKLYWNEKTHMLSPVVFLLIPAHTPDRFESVLVDIKNFFRVAVIGIFRRDL